MKGDGQVNVSPKRTRQRDRGDGDTKSSMDSNESREEVKKSTLKCFQEMGSRIVTRIRKRQQLFFFFPRDIRWIACQVFFFFLNWDCLSAKRSE